MLNLGIAATITSRTGRSERSEMNSREDRNFDMIDSADDAPRKARGSAQKHLIRRALANPGRTRPTEGSVGKRRRDLLKWSAPLDLVLTAVCADPGLLLVNAALRLADKS